MMQLMIQNSGPGLWVLSQALLLLYFKMDNGSNVCGIEFNYDNREKGGWWELCGMEINVCGLEFNYNNEEGKKEEKKENNENNDSKSIVGENEPDIEVHFNDQLLRKLILGKFEVRSEEGRLVH